MTGLVTVAFSSEVMIPANFTSFNDSILTIQII